MSIKKLLILLIFLLSFASCKHKPSDPCVIDCYLESDTVVICLNNQYKIGYIIGGSVGKLEFAEGLIENYEIEYDKKVIKIFIKNDGIIFEDGNDYRIMVESYKGSVKTWSTFNDGKFVPIGFEEAHFSWK